VTRRARQNKSSGRRQGTLSLNPIKQFSAAFKFGHVIRFVGTSAGVAIQCTRAQMLNAIVSNVNATVNNNRILQSVLVKRIVIWSGNNPSTSTFGPTTVTLEWNTQYGPNANISDSVIQNSAVACVDSSPPLRSLASFWSSSGSNESELLFTITTTSQVIIDVHHTFCLSDLGLSTGNTVTAAVGVAGALYYTALDGPRVGAVFTPISLPTLN